ncbi:cupredoxin domain-containing protein [Geodermatophilus ruber]|uniref:Plastocyanin n=1 Tax=Geodermatophilus ruber TaxID=504800 RepID=A0A1I4DA74_9ACTN|nr:cupredoxin domain-containing protein [Geodermatophilus ruber]SFK89799.1 Plastocyanin [Geodermatophilus ruber]
MNGRGRRQRRGAAVLAGAVLLTGVLAGCGGGDEPSGPAPTTSAGPAPGTVTTAPDGVQEVTLQTQDDYVFTPSTFTVAPGTVRLTVANIAEQLTHNFRFRPDAGPQPIAAEIPLLAPGESRTIEFEVTEPGEYPFDCTFHIQLGQSGTMTVSG